VYIFGWTELSQRIRDGSIATDLSRPLSPLRYWLAFDLGRAPYHLIFRGLLPFAIGAVVFRLHYPSPLNALLFVVSVALAVVVSLGVRFLYNLPAFWLLDIRGVLVIAITVNLFFSGMIMPIAFFPSWLGHVAQALPFASALQTPIDIWLGNHHGRELAGVLALQAGWAIVLLALGHFVLGRATRKLVVQGG
jgi:viologen exporter family transport system permease protein